MATHGSNADFIGNGYVLSTYLNTASFSGNRDAAEASTFKVKSKQYVPGLKDTTMSAEGVYDGNIDAVDQVLFAAIDSSVDGLYTYFPMGQETIGNMAYTIDSIESSYEINTEIGDVAQISAEFNAGSKGIVSRGKVARPMAVAAAGGNTAGIDNGAASTGVPLNLVVHATASATLVVKAQHSTDNITFTDLPGTLTFTTGRGSQRLIVPPQSINRYSRVLWTGTGTFMAVIDR